MMIMTSGRMGSKLILFNYSFQKATAIHDKIYVEKSITIYVSPSLLDHSEVT